MTRKSPGVAFFGKVRIPTIGHAAAIDHAKGIANKVKGRLHIGLSGTSHPLSSADKHAHAEKVFNHPVMPESEHTKNLFSFLSHMHKHHDEIHLVAGSDRAGEYKRVLQKYNGKPDKKGNVPFAFKKWHVHEVKGKREESNKDPRKMSRQELTRSVSASKLEKLAKEGNYDHFKAYHPGLDDNHVRHIYDQVRKGSELHESIEIPNIGLTFSRDLMPQLNINNFIKFINNKNIKSELQSKETSGLKATQSDFDTQKIISLMYTNKATSPIIVSNDNYVLDGHHRWLADHNAGNKSVQAYVIDLPILELLKAAKEFSLEESVTHKDFGPMMDGFVSFASEKLGLKEKPKVVYKQDADDFKSFGAYNPASKEITLSTKNRHPMDVFRTLAHELVHHKQNEEGRIKDVAKEGATGSPIEDEANSMAGRLMRWYAQANPKSFELSALVEAVIVVGVPCSGKDRVIRQLKEKYGLREIDGVALQKSNVVQDQDNLIVSCSAENLAVIQEAKDLLEHNGYRTKCLFVNVSNEISRLRNEERKAKGQRVINESVRFEKYSLASQNKEQLKRMFGEDMSIIDNSTQLSGAGVSPQPSKKASLHEKTAKPASAIDAEFSQLLESNTPADREWGTDSLRELYKNATPGQSGDPRKHTTFTKKKIAKKKLNQESQIDRKLPAADGIGPEWNVSKVPGIIGSFSESVQAWANKPETQARFKKKYGDLAEQKLIEAAQKLNKLSESSIKVGPKPLAKLKESFSTEKP